MSIDQKEINQLALESLETKIEAAKAEVARLEDLKRKLSGKGKSKGKKTAAKASAKKRTRKPVQDRTEDAIAFLEASKGKKLAKSEIMAGAGIAANEWLKVSKGLDASKKIKSEGERRNKVYSA